jgi:hypothetical protein
MRRPCSYSAMAWLRSPSCSWARPMMSRADRHPPKVRAARLVAL